MSAGGQTKITRRINAIVRTEQASAYLDNADMRELIAGWLVDCKRTRNHEGDALLAARLRSLAKSYDERPWLLDDTTHRRFTLTLGEAIGLLA